MGNVVFNYMSIYCNQNPAKVYKHSCLQNTYKQVFLAMRTHARSVEGDCSQEYWVPVTQGRTPSRILPSREPYLFQASALCFDGGCLLYEQKYVPVLLSRRRLAESK